MLSHLLPALIFIYVDVLLFSMSKGRNWHDTYAVRVLPSGEHHERL